MSVIRCACALLVTPYSLCMVDNWLTMPFALYHFMIQGDIFTRTTSSVFDGSPGSRRIRTGFYDSIH